MCKKHINFLVPIFFLVLLVGCSPMISDSKKARLVLVDFFNELSIGNYENAVQLYGGSYETLVSFNTDLDPDNLIALWENGCQINGLQCLTARTIAFNEQTEKGEFIFAVEFNTADGDLFVLDACCGESPANPPQSQFEYRVIQNGEGNFQVLDLPVYVP